jgi:hypothetical protein
MTEEQFNQKAQQALAEGKYTADEIAAHKATMKFDPPAAPAPAASAPVSIDSPAMAEAKHQTNEHYSNAVKSQTTNIAGYDVPNSLALPVAAIATIGGAAYLGRKAWQAASPTPAPTTDELMKQEQLRALQLENNRNDPDHPHYAAKNTTAGKPATTTSTAPITTEAAPAVQSTTAPQPPATADLQEKLAQAKAAKAGAAPSAPVVSPNAAPEATTAPVVSDPATELQSTVQKVEATPTDPLTPTNSPNTTLVQTESGAPAITQTAPEGEVKGSALPTTTPTSSTSEPVKLASGAVPHDLNPTNPESFPKGTRPEVVKSVIDWSKANPEQAKQLAAENKVFLPGANAADNHLHNSYGPQGRRNVLNTFNEGNPIGAYDNIALLNANQPAGKSIKDVVGVQPPTEHGVTSKNGRLGIPAALDENGKLFQAGMKANGELNMGTVGSKIKGGALAGLVMGLPMLANAKTNSQRAEIVGNAGMGIMPPALQGLTYSGDAGAPTLPPNIARQLMTSEQKKQADKIEMNRQLARTKALIG